MGKIVSSTFVSLDGVINHMDRWHFDFIDTESDAIALRQLQDSQALLMGRHTYETFAQVWPGRDGEYADRINAMAKYVASRTLHNPTWTNTTVLDGDLVEAVTKLKQDLDRNLLMYGYGPVAKSLLRHGLLDELILWVHPMLAGVGTPDDMILREPEYQARPDRRQAARLRCRPPELPAQLKASEPGTELRIRVGSGNGQPVQPARASPPVRRDERK